MGLEILFLLNHSLNLPDNLFTIGTVNVDETTYMFSPKVLDRANTLEFNTLPAWDYMVSDAMSEVLAQAIDYHIRNAAITGTIITTGSPFTQQAKIFHIETPITTGKVPNTLGIS